MPELSNRIQNVLAGLRQAEGSRGRFGVSWHLETGPLAHHRLVLHRGGRDLRVQELTARRHEDYIECLKLAGLRVPRTELRLMTDASSVRPVIVQEIPAKARLLHQWLEDADEAGTIAALECVAAEILSFWRRMAHRPERIGLQVDVSSILIDHDGPLFTETMPPLIGYNRQEIGILISRFADSGLVRGLGIVLPSRIRDMQNSWYDPAGSMIALCDGALKAAPAKREAILQWASMLASTRLEAQWRAAMQVYLTRQAKRAPRLTHQLPRVGNERPNV